jgi:NACHT domain-containing protein
MAGKTGLVVFGAAAATGPLAALIWPDIIKWIAVAGYEIVVVVVGFAGGVAAELRKRWLARATDSIDQALGRRFTRFQKRYRESMLSSLRFIDVKGLSTVGFYTPDLDEVFVDVSLDYRAPHQVPAGVVNELPPDAEGRHSLWDFLNRKQPAVLAILGAPGSGKTTLLRHTARRVFDNKRRTVPVLLYLRDHISVITQDISLAALVARTTSVTEPSGWFEQHLRDGDCVVLLDGLDEVARHDDRARIAEWVETQIDRYPRNDFVITSRPHGYQSTPVKGALVLQVRSFTDEQVQKFVRGWYLAAVRRATDGTLAEVEQRAHAEADDLLDRLRNSANLGDLTANPLLLTMIANVHRYRGALPGSRADLYSEICQVMLWRRQEAKKLPSSLSGDKKEALLRGLAFTMMERRVRDLPAREVLEEIKVPLQRMSRKVPATEFLADASSNGLLVERESGLYSFAHLTFQEYLAAAQIREKGLVAILADNVEDVWWRETTLLYTARSDADPIVAACLKSDTVTALSLAFDCSEQDSELDPELTDRLEKVTEDAFVPGAAPDRVALAAGVLLTRHLRQTVPAGAGSRVCTAPITKKIYELFRPTGRDFTDDEVVGVHRADAQDFVRWVNTIMGGQPGYRLATWAEITEPVVQRALNAASRSAWLDTVERPLWTTVDPHPHLVAGQTQIDHVTADIRRSTNTLTRCVVLYAVIASRRVAPHDGERLAIELARVLSISERDTDLDSALDRSFSHASAVHGTTTDLDLTHIVEIAWRIEQLRRSSDSTVRIQDVVNDLVQMAARLRIKTDVETELDGLLLTDRSQMHAAATEFAKRPTPVSLESMGVSIGHALSRALIKGIHWKQWPLLREGTDFVLDNPGSPHDFTRAFIEYTRAGDEHTVDLDGLADLAVKTPIFFPDRAWASEVAHYFSQAALPVFRRQEPLTPQKATALRLAALCLGAEWDSDEGEMYRRLAAGVTLIERRTNGQAPITETVIIAER